MAATTSESRQAVLKSLEPKLEGADLALAGELYDALHVLDENAALRRALTDPSRAAEAKADVVRRLFASGISPVAQEVLAQLVSERWSEERALGDTLEEAATTAAVSVAEKQGAQGLDTLQAELLSFVDAVASNHDLQWALEDRQAPTAAKVKLALGLLPNASDVARSLIAQAVARPRGLRPAALVERFAQVVARRQRRWIATVSVTRPLSQEQSSRLLAGLNALYGRDLRLNVVIDRAVLGGLRVEVGDEVVDATAATRLSDLSRRLAG